jgi:hypothetical protein
VKIDRVVFCCDTAPEFSSFWELNSELYRRVFGITPTLFYFSDANEFIAANLSTRYGEVYHLESQVPGYTRPEGPSTRNAATTLALLHGPQLFPDEVVMTSGIDQFPLSRRFFDAVEDSDKDMVIGFAGCRDYTEHPVKFGCRYYPSSHVVARSSTWRTVLQGEDDWGKDLPRMWNSGVPVMWPAYGCNWGVDEAFLSQRIASSSVEVDEFSTEFFEEWEKRRISRPRVQDINFDRSSLGDFYSELHANRPMFPYEEVMVRRFIDRNTPPFFEWENQNGLTKRI